MKQVAKYQQIIDQFTAGFLAEPAFFALPPELELQSLWFSGAYGRHFDSTDGRRVEIKHFGEWNRAAGPDFFEVQIEIGGKKLKGSLEFDSYPEDWEIHGHGENAAYDGVCLHVTALPSRRGSWFTRNSQHQEIPLVILGKERLLNQVTKPIKLQALSQLGHCSTPLQDMAASDLESLLSAASQYRLQKKSKRIHALIEVQGPDQALYQLLAEALGFRVNQQSMFLFSQQIPLSMVKKHPSEALLFGAAGLLEHFPKAKMSDEVKDYLRCLWDDWWQIRSTFECSAERLPKWKFSGQRPHNHLHRRLGALAEIVKKWDSFRSAFHRSKEDPQLLVKWFAELRHPYWDHHATLSCQKLARRCALVGNERAVTFWVNHVLAWHGVGHESAMQVYSKMRAPKANDAVMRAVSRLLGKREDRHLFVRLFWQQQGLQQIYQDFCLQDFSACEQCPFPQQLRQWQA